MLCRCFVCRHLFVEFAGQFASFNKLRHQNVSYICSLLENIKLSDKIRGYGKIDSYR